MAEDNLPTSSPMNLTTPSSERKLKRTRRGGKGKKRAKQLPEYQVSAKPTAKVGDSKKARRLIRKRVREYNSDDDEGSEGNETQPDQDSPVEGDSDGEEDDDLKQENSSDHDEGDGEIQLGITKFAEGCRAFRVAFTKIMKKHTSSDLLGPVLSAHKKLVVQKLAEEMVERKSKGEAKKEKLLKEEKGHVKPASFLDSKEKFLISVATKGVVKLFNAVNKAQNSQKDPSSSKMKDVKAMQKQRKEAFMSDLRRPITDSRSDFNTPKANFEEENEEPNWAPLQDSYMLTNPKLKDWDKMPNPSSVNDSYRPLQSSDEE